MKRSLFLLIILCAALFAKAEKRSIDITSFKFLKVNGAFQVYFTTGAEYKMTIEASADDFEGIIIDQKDSTLQISRNANRIHGNIYLQAPSFSALLLEGRNHFYTKNAIVAKTFKAEINGACQAKIEINATDLELSNNGATEVMMVGKCDNAQIKSDGASTFDGRTLICQRIKADAYGATKVHVFGQESVIAKAHGASALYYNKSTKSPYITNEPAASVRHYN